MMLLKKLYDDGFVTKVTDIEFKKPDTRDLLNKANCNAKIKEIVHKIPNIRQFFITREFNRLTEISFDQRMKEIEKDLQVKLMEWMH